MAEGRLCIGRIVGSRGLKGEIKVRLFLENPLDIERFLPLTDENGKQMEITGLNKTSNNSGGIIVCMLKSCASQEEAQHLRGIRLFSSTEKLLTTKEDEFYSHQLVGLKVMLVGGNNFGTITDVSNFGAGGVVQISTEDGKEAMFILDRENFVEINLEEGYAILDPPQTLAEG